MEDEIRVRVNQEKLEMESLWDGLHGVFTDINEKEMDAETVLFFIGRPINTVKVRTSITSSQSIHIISHLKQINLKMYKYYQ